MDEELYAASIDYELLTKQIYEDILKLGGPEPIDVLHDRSITGRSGVGHQVDVHWKFKQAGIFHTVLIECKNYATPVTLERIRSFYAVLHDIGNCKGLMVTRTGFQSGVAKFAEFYGIDLKLLRKSTANDWKGRIKDITVIMTAKSAVSSKEHPIQVTCQAEPVDRIQAEQLLKFLNKGVPIAPSGPETVFVDKDGNPIADEMRWWLPRKLHVRDKEDGGPYEEIIELENHYVNSGIPDLANPFVRVKKLKVVYWVESKDIREIKIHGEEIVKAVLIDNMSGDHEYVKW
jgi:hypothetical protein